MTDKKVIKLAQELITNFKCDSEIMVDFCNTVIKKFEQELCEDCISRQAMLDVIDFEDEWLFDANSHNADTKIAFSTIKSKISEMPSVTPTISKMEQVEDCIDREDAINKIEEWADGFEDGEYFSGKSVADAIRACGGIIAELPSVTPSIPDVENDFNLGYNCGYADAMNDIAESEVNNDD